MQVIATVFLRPWIRFVTELSLTINFIIIKKNLVLLPKPMCIAASSRWIIIWSRTPNLRRLPRRNKGDCYGGYFEGLPFLGGGCFTKAWQMNSCPGGWIYVYERSCVAGTCSTMSENQCSKDNVLHWILNSVLVRDCFDLGKLFHQFRWVFDHCSKSFMIAFRQF